MTKYLYLAGRGLLGLYFILPAIMKITDFNMHVDYMASHGMIFIPFFLVLTIIIQLGGGVALIIGYRQQWVAFVLAGLVLVISIVMHDFWTMEEGIQKAHEMQNFIKNMAIMAGLLVVAGGYLPEDKSS